MRSTDRCRPRDSWSCSSRRGGYQSKTERLSLRSANYAKACRCWTSRGDRAFLFRTEMKALVLKKPGKVVVEAVPDPVVTNGDTLLKVRMVGFCGSDLNSFRGLNPLISLPRILGHEVSATIVQPGDSGLSVGTDVALSPYTSCGQCASCRRGRPNACQFNQTLGVQRDGALTEYIVMPREKLYPAKLSLKELCLVEPLTVGFHAVSRGRVAAEDVVAIFGCGGVGLGAVGGASARGAN